MNKKPEAIAIKGALIVLLILLLLIPTFFINSLIDERKNRQNEAITEVSAKWAESQTISGPIISIPYFEYVTEQNGKINKYRRYIHVLPEKLIINGELFPEKRYRGIFEVVVYGSQINISGSFVDIVKNIPTIPVENILYDQAFVSVGISDLRGVKEQIELTWGDEKLSFNSGIESNDILNSGISVPIKLAIEDINLNNSVSFNFKLNLNGSQYVYFSPIGKETLVKISSKWTNPSFDGAFLPDSREIDETGFKANWKILELNRNYPQKWIGSSYSLENSSFGINLKLPIDSYVKTDRSIKYAILFIALTFMIFFFLELLNNKSIHYLQYILIGFALCIFYVLLLSISEHLNYNIAYFISAFMTIGLIAWYSRSILNDKKLSTLIAGNLVILYGFIFVIIQIQDYALLVGSIGLFVILAIVMHFSKKIDWESFKQ